MEVQYAACFRQRAHAVANGARLLGLHADEEAGAVHQMHHGQVEGLRELYETRELLRRVGRPAAGVDVGVRRRDGDRPAVEAGEAGDQRPAETAADLEEAAAIDHRLDDGADLVDLAPVARHRFDQEVLAPVRGILARGARRQLERRRRQVGEEAARPCERLLLALHLVVDGAVGHVDGAAAELLLGHRLAEAGNHRRAGDEHLRPFPHDQRIVAGRHPRRAEPGDRPEREGDHGHRPHVVDDEIPRRIRGYVRVAVALQRAHRAAAAGTLDEADQRQPQLVRHLLGGDLLGLDPGVGGAAAHREIVADDDDAPPVEAGPAEHDVGGSEGLEAAAGTVLRLAGDGADLVQAARVDQRVDALAHGEAAVVVLALDLLRPAHLARQGLAPAQLRDFRLPTPRRPLRTVVHRPRPPSFRPRLHA